MVRMFALVSACAVMACSSDSPSSLRFGVADPTATVIDEFTNGDVLLSLEGAQRRVQLNFTPTTDELPGIACSWLRPARDGTEFVHCAHTYVRAPGEAWERLAMPDEPSQLLGQAKDGTRYFADVITNAIVAQLPGAATFMPVAGLTTNALEISSHGDFLARGPNSVSVLVGGVPGPAIPLPVYGLDSGSSAVSDVAPLVDESGFIYIRTENGTHDRYQLETGARDAAWFAAPGGANPSYRFMGVSSDGALFAISESNEGISSGQKDNEVEIGNLMSRHRGDGEWQSAGAMFGLGYLAFEQPPRAWPGRDGTWWLSTCIANCAGIAGRSQKEIVRWQPSGSASVPAVPTTYQAYANIGFVIATGAGRHELTFDDADCEPVPGSDVFAVIYAVCRATGRHTAKVVTKTASGAIVDRVTVSIDVVAPPAQPVRPPRHRTLFELSSSVPYYAYVGADGLLHTYLGGATPTDLALAQPAGVIALSFENTTLLTADGAVFRWTYGQTLEATRVNVPPAAAISGTFMVGTDGNVYPVVDGAQPVTGISGGVSLDCETLYPAGMAREYCTTLDSTGRTWTFERVGVNVISVQEQAADPMLAAVTRGGGLSRTGQWYRRIEGTAWLEPSSLVDFTGATRTGHQSGTGNFYVPTALMVTRGGEAWISAFEGANNYGVSLPPGRTAVAIEPALAGAFVWLDDGRVGYVSIPSVQMGGAPGGFVWTPLPVTVTAPGPR